MSRSGYSEDGDQWSLIKWRGAVASAMRGKRGQAFLRERQLHRVTAYGIETYACDKCLGNDPDEDNEE